MSLESTIRDALNKHDSGLTRAELLKATRHYDDEQTIMRMIGKMLSSGKVLYSGDGRYTWADRKTSAGAPAKAVATPAAPGPVQSKTPAPADRPRRKSRDVVLGFFDSGRHTAKEIITASNLPEQTVGHHLRNLVREGILQSLPNPGDRRSPLYERVQAIGDDPEPAPIQPPPAEPGIEALKPALASLQTTLSQISSSLRAIEELVEQQHSLLKRSLTVC